MEIKKKERTNMTDLGDCSATCPMKKDGIKDFIKSILTIMKKKLTNKPS